MYPLVPISVVKASFRVDTIEVAISFRICVFNSASYVHFRVFLCFWRRFSLDLREFDYAVKLIWRKPSGQNKISIAERSSASPLRIEWYSYLPLMVRWSGLVQFSVWPFDFPDFVGRALSPAFRIGLVSNTSNTVPLCTGFSGYEPRPKEQKNNGITQIQGHSGIRSRK